MLVLGLVCSPRSHSNTEMMMEAALAGARSYGAETELWTAAGKKLEPCNACEVCVKNGGLCNIQDDMRALYPRIEAADGLILGSPSYYMSVTAQAKTVMDLLYGFYTNYKLVNKVAGVISVAGSVGNNDVAQQFINFIWLRGAPRRGRQRRLRHEEL
ncbi:MAG: flavodoxin family protein [Chloroflexi bacterium]|nr:flavodoxin family protein [Chloroflexota bacterium]